MCDVSCENILEWGMRVTGLEDRGKEMVGDVGLAMVDGDARWCWKDV